MAQRRSFASLVNLAGRRLLLSRRLLARGACAAFVVATANASLAFASVDALAEVDGAQRQLVVRLRSFVPGASGRVVVEPTQGGGRVRVLAARLPAPNFVAPGARAFVVWATGGELRRLGELRRDARGDAAFEFAHPAGLETYSVVVTAEANPQADRPAGAFVFSTRANEVSALYPLKPEPRTETRAVERAAASEATVRARTVTRPPATMPASTSLHPSTSLPARSSLPTRSPLNARAPSSVVGAASEFYESVDAAVEDPAAARTLTLDGVGAARRARGDARVATREGTAYVRVRFRRVPPPARFGVRKYVMWAQTPDDGSLFLRALPARGLNRRPTYARRRNVGDANFQLLVTAERNYPHPRPRGRRVMTTIK